MTVVDPVLVIVRVFLDVVATVTLPKSMELGLAVMPPPGEMIVTSVAVLLARFVSPPPDTVTVFVTDAGALLETLAVKATVG